MNEDFMLESFHSGTNCFAHKFFGCHKIRDGKYVFRVWAPRAETVSLVGTFNCWNENKTIMTKLSDNESFEAVVTAENGDTYEYCITTFDG